MTFEEFLKKYNRQKNVGNTPDNTGQCVGLVMVWLASQNQPHIWGHAKDLLTNADRNFYEVILNTPEAIPQKGDVIVWGQGFNSTYGHTAICTGKTDVNTFEVFEQNNPIGSDCHLRAYKNYAYVLGWLRPKSAIITQPIMQFNDQTKIPGNLLTSPGFPVNEDIEIQALRSILADAENRRKDLENTRQENEQLKTNLKECGKKLSKWQQRPPKSDISANYTWFGLLDYLRHLLNSG